MECNDLSEIPEETVEADESNLTDEKQSIPAKPSHIPLKKQPERLCNCPLHCDTKFNKDWKEKIYKQFGELPDHATQNIYIQRHIKIKSIAKRLWEDEIIDKKIQRRVTCKYLIPTTGSVLDSYSFAKTLDYDTVKNALDTKAMDMAKQSILVQAAEKAESISINGVKESNESITSPEMSNGNTTPETATSDSKMEIGSCDSKMETENFNTTGDVHCNTLIEAMDLSVNRTQSTESCNTTIENDTLSTTIGNGTFDTTTGNETFNTTIENGTPTTTMGTDSCTNTMETDHSTNPLPVKVNGICEETEDRVNSISTQVEAALLSKETLPDVNSPMSCNDNESVHTADETSSTDLSSGKVDMKYVEVCQKAFMNMYGITEKRIRWQREKLILKSRYLAEKKKKELEEMDRTLSLARSLGAGCQPLFAMLEKSNCKQLSEQLLVAIEDDVAMVNNFFHNQLWKPEDIMNKSVYFSNLDSSCETEYD